MDPKHSLSYFILKHYKYEYNIGTGISLIWTGIVLPLDILKDMWCFPLFRAAGQCGHATSKPSAGPAGPGEERTGGNQRGEEESQEAARQKCQQAQEVEDSLHQEGGKWSPVKHNDLFLISAVDPNTLNLDPDPHPWLPVCINFEKILKNSFGGKKFPVIKIFR